MADTIVLLRGINLAGKRKVPMGDLRAALADAGLDGVRTHLATGNVLVPPDAGSPDEVAASVAEVVASTFGFDVDVVARSADDLAAAIDASPYADDEDDHAKVHVLFLGAEPDPDDVAALDPDRSPGDRFSVIGREIHLHLPNGAARTKLGVDWFERHLGTTATGRNLRTAQRLLELARES